MGPVWRRYSSAVWCFPLRAEWGGGAENVPQRLSLIEAVMADRSYSGNVETFSKSVILAAELEISGLPLRPRFEGNRRRERQSQLLPSGRLCVLLCTNPLRRIKRCIYRTEDVGSGRLEIQQDPPFIQLCTSNIICSMSESLPTDPKICVRSS